MLKNFVLLFLIEITVFGCEFGSPENSEAIQNLKQLLVESPESIPDLNTEISKDKADLAVQMIHENRSDELRKKYTSFLLSSPTYQNRRF